MEGANIETAIRDICEISVAHLEPNQVKGEFKLKEITKEYYLIFDFVFYFRPK